MGKIPKDRERIKVYGYSERGVINTLLYEIAYASNPTDLINGILKLAHWPLSSTPPDHLFSANCKTILIEQSLSDFGDADVIFLFNTTTTKSCIFCEAKCGVNWIVKKEWEKFIGQIRNNIKGKSLTSNLFCQLYFKQRLVNALTSGENVSLGLKFDGPFALARGNGRRKIGTNPVVLATIDYIKSYLSDTYYLMLIPQVWSQDICLLFKQINDEKIFVRDLDISQWGVISWHDIKKFCESKKLGHTLSVLEFNKGQIF